MEESLRENLILLLTEKMMEYSFEKTGSATHVFLHVNPVKLANEMLKGGGRIDPEAFLGKKTRKQLEDAIDIAGL